MNGALMRQQMNQGQVLFGISPRLARSTEIVAVAKAAGYDWLFIDMEHGALSIDIATQMCIAGLDAGLMPLVRIPGYEPTFASRLTDNGAVGIVVPHVDTVAQIMPVIERCKFAPIGRRSTGGPLPQLGYASMPLLELMREANERTLIIPMVESPESVANAEAIAALPGVDGFLFGTNDLSIEMGIAGELGHARIGEAYETVIAAAKRHGKVVGLGGIPAGPLMERYLPLGFHYALLDSDLGLILSNGKKSVTAAHKMVGRS